MFHIKLHFHCIVTLQQFEIVTPTQFVRHCFTFLECKIASARMRMRCTMTTVLGKKETFLGRWYQEKAFLWFRSCVGVLSVVSRCSLDGIWQGIRDEKGTAILTKRTFSVWEFFSLFYVLRFSSEWELFGRNTRSAIRGTSSSLVCPWFLTWRLQRNYKETQILINSLYVRLSERINILSYPLSLPIS